MKIQILNIGDELLIGQVVNTNASLMAEMLTLAGFSVSRVLTISDAFNEIIVAFEESLKQSDVVIVSGGLGPTSDDRTREALCAFYQCDMHRDTAAYGNLLPFFESRGLQITEVNARQADVPDACKVLQNPLGTSPGMLFEKKGQMLFALPGVPFELEYLMENEVIPIMEHAFSPTGVVHKTVLTTGVGESYLSEKIKEWEQNLPSEISLAYLPQPGVVKLRLLACSEDKIGMMAIIEKQINELQQLIPKLIFGFDNDSLESVIGKLMRENNSSLSTAESCTGGYVAHLITSVPGSSHYFKGSVVSYDNELKVKELNVNEDDLKIHGAVSETVVHQMAEHIRNKFGTTYSIAVSGVAGPDGGSPEKPVGTTWIAVAGPTGVSAKKFLFGDHRGRNIRRAALAGLNMLRLVMGEE